MSPLIIVAIVVVAVVVVAGLAVNPLLAKRGDAAIAEAEPTSPWQPTSAPEIEALCLMIPPIAEDVKRKLRMPLRSASS